MNLSQIKKILKTNELAPSKKRGQNFLVHQSTSERIVQLAGVTGNDSIIELGVGLGSLSIPIAASAKDVTGIEIDSGIIEFHRNNNLLPDNFKIIHHDLLTLDFARLAMQQGSPLKIMANLPYSISNPLLFKLLETSASLDWAVLMLQKEVGERIASPAGSKVYGILSVLFAGVANVTTLMKVGPEQFHPRPKVDSVIVKIDFIDKKLPKHNTKLLFKIVKAGFQKRRKTLLNSLSSASSFEIDKDTLKDCLIRAGVAPTIRPEKLTVHEFIAITNELETILQE
jgi:16S rRNA (adenine1518-N6/adenine1519-N6)-dimethyltransferase